jgi:nicotinate dehydrogenase subunit B
MGTAIVQPTCRTMLAGLTEIIETGLINRVEGEAMGAGELSMTLSPAAIGNAIFDATGARLRQIPFASEHALKART